MSHISLGCPECGTSHAADMSTLRCRKCTSPLDVQYAENLSCFDIPQLPGWTGPEIPLPVHDRKALVSLGEGNTPCVQLDSVGRLLGLKKLYAKLEFMNPTGSFKDRGTAIMMSVAREKGVKEVVEDSSGNAGASVSAYAARAGIKAHVFAPSTAPTAKIQQIKVYGAQTHQVEGPREATTEAAVAFYTERSLVYASHNMSPYFIEGTKIFAYEVSNQFSHALPDHILVPVGNGALFTGAWKGFKELRSAGLVSAMPRLHAIQARAVMPIVAAYIGQEWAQEPGVTTIAGGISVGKPPSLNQVLNVLKESNGIAVGVADDEIIRWQKLLAEKEGIYGEPTSATAFAGLDELVRQGEIRPGDTVLIPITGFGLKDAPPV